MVERLADGTFRTKQHVRTISVNKKRKVNVAMTSSSSSAAAAAAAAKAESALSKYSAMVRIVVRHLLSTFYQVTKSLSLPIEA